MELVILVALLGLVIMFFRRFSSFVYSVAIIDILLRILEYIKYNIGNRDIMMFIDKYFPSSILKVINKYSTGIINDILSWAYIAIMVVFLYYTIRVFIKKKK